MAYHNHFMREWLKCSNLRLFLYFSHRNTSRSSSRNVFKNDLFEVHNDQILQEKSYKWGDSLFKKLLKHSTFSRNDNLAPRQVNLYDNCTKEELTSKVLDCVGERDLNNLITILEISRKKSFCLPDGLMLYLIRLFAKLGHKEGFDLMLVYFKDFQEIQFNRKGGFEYYKAEVLWYGGNAEKSLLILERLYESKKFQHDVNLVVYDIISDAVNKRGEALLVLVTNFSQKLVKNYKIYYPMVALWKHLYESEWFADQQLADRLLHDDNELLKLIMPVIPLWCKQNLKCHKIDVVHRLCEVLLRNNYLEYYSSVAHDFFDYHYNRQNLKGCTAVVKSMLDLQLQLKESHQKRFLVLLLVGKHKPASLNCGVKIPKSIENQINMKF